MKKSHRAYIVLGMVLAVAASACSKIDQAAPPPGAQAGGGGGAAAAGAAQPQAPIAQTAAKTTPGASTDGTPIAARRALEVKATMEATVATSDDATRLASELARTAREHGGFVSESTLGAGGPAHVVVRIPATDIGALRAALGGAGTITRETVQTTDVTDALADLDARLRAAREEEKRLLELLEKRTGSLNDVLASERALSGVRERIEQLEAQQRVAQGRVDLATVDVWLRPKASTSSAPEAGIGERLGAAAHDGVVAAKEVSLALVSLGLRGGPTALMLAALAWGLVAAVRRALRLRGSRVSSPA